MNVKQLSELKDILKEFEAIVAAAEKIGKKHAAQAEGQKKEPSKEALRMEFNIEATTGAVVIRYVGKDKCVKSIDLCPDFASALQEAMVHLADKGIVLGEPLNLEDE